MLSVDELIKLAKIDLDELPKETLDDIHRFILTLKIKEGRNKIKHVMLYKAYKMWSMKPASYRSFFDYFSNFFTSLHSCKKKNQKSSAYHMLNYTTIELLNKIDNTKEKYK